MHEDIQGLGKELDKRLTKSSADAAKEKGSHGSQRKVGEGELKYFEHNGLTEPLLGTQSDLLIGVERLSIQNKNIQKNIEDLEVLSSRLQSGAMNFRMVPISNLFNRFPAQVRDIARQIGKRVELRISGAETELDKILINQLADPLLHLIRNSIDHGIENPQTRAEMKKGEVGQIDLRAYYLGSNAIIEIEDDGKGIDANVILKKAIEKGLIADGQRTDILEKEIFDFIFEPGFSSAEKVTELSGRGVGMDVVKTSISRMQGSIKVQSKVNSGTVVTLRLPLTLAVVGILLVSENGYEFAFPILNVDEVIHINLTKDIKRINETLVYNFRSELVPVNYLSDFLDYPKNPNQTGDNFLLILNDGETKIGVIVDAVLGQQNVLLKQLGSLIEKAPFVIGCTILSNSKLVLILNVLELTQHNTKAETAMVYEKIERGDQVELQRSSANVLVVDDSGIQRKRICSFLEINGYKTMQASDGYEALNLAKDEKVNAFCIDIQMPLMDGYELIDRLRCQTEHKSTPIFVISGVHMNKDNAVSLLSEKKIQNFYEKPVDLESLLADLDEHCQINRNENFLETV
jgi:two-component system chemotaxis sensor kinase CheA